MLMLHCPLLFFAKFIDASFNKQRIVLDRKEEISALIFRQFAKQILLTTRVIKLPSLSMFIKFLMTDFIPFKVHTMARINRSSLANFFVKRIQIIAQ